MKARERRVLDSLDLLPEDCQDDVVWALAQLNGRERTQADILFELNDRLAVKGQGPVSKSAFSRRSVRLKRRADRIAERNAIYAGIVDKITPETMAEQDIVLGELLKTLIDELIDEARSPEDVKELASAYKQTVAAQHLSASLKEKAMKAAEKKLEEAVKSATDEAGKAGHVVDLESVLGLIRKAYRGE
ncbi:phage protein Gp27 family protein [Aliihoeflea sp. PC F10.4]